MNYRLRTNKAFTLIEILFVVLILVVLMAVVMIKLRETDLTAKRSADMMNMREINMQVEKWHFDKGTWPQKELKDIAAEKKYFPNGIPLCPVDGTRYVLDEIKHRVVPHKHKIVDGE